MSYNVFDYLAFYAFIAYMFSIATFLIFPRLQKYSILVGFLFCALLYVLPNTEKISLNAKDILLVILNIVTIFLTTSGLIRLYTEKKNPKPTNTPYNPNQKAGSAPEFENEKKNSTSFRNKLIGAMKTKWL